MAFSAFLGFGEEFSFDRRAAALLWSMPIPNRQRLVCPRLLSFPVLTGVCRRFSAFIGDFRRLSVFSSVFQRFRLFSAFLALLGFGGKVSFERRATSLFLWRPTPTWNARCVHALLTSSLSFCDFNAWRGITFSAASNCIAVVDTHFQQAMPGVPVLAGFFGVFWRFPVFLAFFGVFAVFRVRWRVLV